MQFISVQLVKNSMPKTQVNTWASPKHSLQWWPDSLPSLGCPWWIVSYLQKAPIAHRVKTNSQSPGHVCMFMVPDIKLEVGSMFIGLLDSTTVASWLGSIVKSNALSFAEVCRFCLINHVDIGCSSGIGGLFVLLDSFTVSFIFFLPGMCFGFLGSFKARYWAPIKGMVQKKRHHIMTITRTPECWSFIFFCYGQGVCFFVLAPGRFRTRHSTSSPQGKSMCLKWVLPWDGGWTPSTIACIRRTDPSIAVLKKAGPSS